MLLRPGIENKEYTFMFDGVDKIMHLLIFLFLGFSFRAAFPKMSTYYTVLIMFIYAVLTEILQEIMNLGRSGEYLDLLADFSGITLGLYVYSLISSGPANK